jgi:hypothetical protein
VLLFKCYSTQSCCSCQTDLLIEAAQRTLAEDYVSPRHRDRCQDYHKRACNGLHSLVGGLAEVVFKDEEECETYTSDLSKIMDKENACKRQEARSE